VRIGVIGAGDMGGALAVALAPHHDVVVAGSQSGSASVAATVREAQGSLHEASVLECAETDICVLTVPWASIDAALDVLQATPPRRILSVVVPWTGDDAQPALGTSDSVAEFVARKLMRSSVAGAFTTVAASTIRAIKRYREKPTVFVTSDDAETKRIARELAESIGFTAIDAGPLYAARFTEAMGFLWTSLAFQGGAGEMVAFRTVLPE